MFFFKNPRALLLMAFLLSGMSGLIYQTVWIRMLTRYLGSTTAATATVLSVFMGGLALGSFLGGRFADKIKRLLRSYAALEVLIAIAALASALFIIRYMGQSYIDLHDALGDNMLLVFVARIMTAAGSLILPTVLMGATLPYLVAFITRTGKFQEGLGRLYSINTFGAVFGVLLAGFVLIGSFGEWGTFAVAVVLNLSAAWAAFYLDRITEPIAAVSGKSAKIEVLSDGQVAYSPRVRLWSRAALFWSGFSALAFEVLWIRWLVLPLKTSIYSFSFMLSLVLLGIAVGSWFSTRIGITRRRPLAMFALSMVLIGVLTTAGLLVFSHYGQETMGFLIYPGLGMLTAALMILPVALVYGWQFPIAVRCSVVDPDKPGRETGLAYAVNTTGTILGSLSAGFVFIPLIGTAWTFILIAAISVGMGFRLLALADAKERGYFRIASVVIAAPLVVIVALKGDPYGDVMHDRARVFLGEQAQIYEILENTAGTTAPAGSPVDKLLRHLFVNGFGMTTLVSETKVMAHLPLELAKKREKMLVICFGMGSTFRSATKSLYTLKQLDAVDIVPDVFSCYHYFHEDAEAIKALPYTHLHGDDGRNFLLLSQDEYDVITIDPAPPIYSAGTVNLYTKEFIQLCRSQLADGGVLCLWLPPAPREELLMIMKSFTEVFPDATLWGGLSEPGFFLMGGNNASFEQTPESMRTLAEKLATIEDLSEWEELYGDPDMLEHLYVYDAQQLRELVADSSAVTDNYPWTEFPLWRGNMDELGDRFVADDLRDPPLNIESLQEKLLKQTGVMPDSVMLETPDPLAGDVPGE